jgi:hypothetical protein
MIYIKISVRLIIYAVLFIPPPALFASSPDSSNIKDSSTTKGATIGQIFIDNINVSGPSLQDGDEWEPGLFGRLGNALHPITKKSVIKSILLFKTGDSLSSWNLSESERLLRKTGYFYDARIRTENTDNVNRVNVKVVTKDKWTLTPQVSYNPKDKNGYLGFKDKNFLGLGHTAEADVTYNENDYIGWGGKSGYTIKNIQGSFVDASAVIESNHKSNMFQLNLVRPFFTVKTEWAGGIDFTWQHDDLILINPGNKISLIPHSFDSQDLWLGRSFPILFGTKDFRNNSSFIFSGKYFRQHFRLRPIVLPDSNRIFENNRLYLFSLGLLSRKFYKTFFVDGFGVTEDIPLGGLISLTTGSDEGEFYNRWYLGMQLLYSTQITTIGYFSGNFEIGGYHYRNKWEQSTIKLDFYYHSPLFIRNNWKTRFFLQNNYILGFERFKGEQIYLDRSNGIQGFDDPVVPGTKRNVLNLEMRIFSPYSVLGFVIGGITFANFGLISDANMNLLSSRLYQGYGFGLRTQNESISETKFELALVYNPYHPAYGRGNPEVILSASFVLGSRDFNFDEPKTVKFKDDEQ